MASITLTTSGVSDLDQLNAACAWKNYAGTANPGETKLQFIKRKLGEEFKVWVVEGAALSAANTARDAARASVAGLTIS